MTGSSKTSKTKRKRKPKPVKLLQFWNGYHPGTVFTDMGGGVAELLISRGIAEYESNSNNNLFKKPSVHH